MTKRTGIEMDCLSKESQHGLRVPDLSTRGPMMRFTKNRKSRGKVYRKILLLTAMELYVIWSMHSTLDTLAQTPGHFIA